MAGLRFAIIVASIGALVLFVYTLFQFSDPGPDMENALRGLLGLGLTSICLALLGLGLGLRDIAD